MSKKSRRRNKRLLMLAALAGGAALAGRGKGTAQGVSGSDKAKFTSDAAYSPAPKAVTGTTYPGANKAADAAAITGVQEGNTRLKRGGIGPNEAAIANRLTAGNRVPPSMRGGALHAQGYTPRHIRSTHPRMGNIYKKGGSVKKAKVTGIAKRGFGRALMKGKK